MNVSELRETLHSFFPDSLDVRVDVGGNVKDIDHLTILHDGTDIVLIVPAE